MQRLLQIEKEQARVAAHDGPFIDTNLWNPGVMQRTKTNALAEYLAKERHQTIDRLSAIEAELVSHRATLVKTAEQYEHVRTDFDKLFLVNSELKRVVEGVLKTKVADEVDSALLKQSFANDVQKQRQAQNTMEQNLLLLGAKTLAGVYMYIWRCALNVCAFRSCTIERVRYAHRR
jgi:hypothetical protein